MCAKRHTDLMTFVHDLMFFFEARKVVVMPVQKFMLPTEVVSRQIRLNYSAVTYFKQGHKSSHLPLLIPHVQSSKWNISMEWLMNVK